MPLNFSDALGPEGKAPPFLRLVHTTSSPSFEFDIQPQQKLKTEACTVYRENLLYFYLLKPSYLPHDCDATRHADMKQFAPVCLVLKVPTAIPPKRIVPFDSGAYEIIKKEGHAHRSLRRGLFELQDTDSPRRIIDIFYGSDAAYYDEQPLTPPLVDPKTNTCVETYFSLISRTGSNQGDSRLNSIEVQYAVPINLDRPGTVLAVAMAESLYSQRQEIQTAMKAWSAEPLLYDLAPRFTARGCCETINRMIRNFLHGRQLLS